MKWFLGILGAVILIILAIVLIARSGPDTARPVTPQTTLTDYLNSDAVMRLTIDGRIVAKEKHNAVRITVGRTNRTVEILKGYDFTAEQTRQLENDIAAFNTFLHAIQNAGFANQRQNSNAPEDETGVCPTGTRYIYEVIDGNDKPVRLWSTSCGSREGTFGGNASLVRQLFQAQIPEYNQVTRGVQL